MDWQGRLQGAKTKAVLYICLCSYGQSRGDVLELGTRRLAHLTNGTQLSRDRQEQTEIIRVIGERRQGRRVEAPREDRQAVCGTSRLL
jgi:hypothetical protein